MHTDTQMDSVPLPMSLEAQLSNCPETGLNAMHCTLSLCLCVGKGRWGRREKVEGGRRGRREMGEEVEGKRR